jgi:hypothetical protein
MSVFENGLSWILYTQMESSFIEFLEYVSYVYNHQKVYSPKLLSLLLQIGGYIDTIFKEMAKYDRIRNIPECQKLNKAVEKDRYNIGYARTAFERIYRLSLNNEGTIVPKLPWLTSPPLLTPFKKFAQNSSPKWWTAYNKAKHEWSEWLHQANMKNVLEALAGAFLLNVIHFPSQKRLWLIGVLKTVYQTGVGVKEAKIPELVFDQLQKTAITQTKPLAYPFRVETPLFVYEFSRASPIVIAPVS